MFQWSLSVLFVTASGEDKNMKPNEGHNTYGPGLGFDLGIQRWQGLL